MTNDRGTTRPPTSIQARVVLAALALAHPRTLSADRLADIVWDEERPESWRPALRGLVSKVRASLAGCPDGPAVQLDPAGYRLVTDGVLEVDVRQVSEHAALAEIASEIGDLDEAVELAAVVTGLTDATFVPSADSLWVRSRRTELTQARVRALHVLARAHLARLQPERAVRTACEAVKLAPTNEASHRLLMRSLAAAGETAEAARAYDRCRSALVDELGIGPAPQTTELLQQILRTTS